MFQPNLNCKMLEVQCFAYPSANSFFAHRTHTLQIFRGNERTGNTLNYSVAKLQRLADA